jgi:hypothetical protein
MFLFNVNEACLFLKNNNPNYKIKKNEILTIFSPCDILYVYIFFFFFIIMYTFLDTILFATNKVADIIFL